MLLQRYTTLQIPLRKYTKVFEKCRQDKKIQYTIFTIPSIFITFFLLLNSKITQHFIYAQPNQML